jgi:hypothetical protein
MHFAFEERDGARMHALSPQRHLQQCLLTRRCRWGRAACRGLEAVIAFKAAPSQGRRGTPEYLLVGRLATTASSSSICSTSKSISSEAPKSKTLIFHLGAGSHFL